MARCRWNDPTEQGNPSVQRLTGLADARPSALLRHWRGRTADARMATGGTALTHSAHQQPVPTGNGTD